MRWLAISTIFISQKTAFAAPGKDVQEFQDSRKLLNLDEKLIKHYLLENEIVGSQFESVIHSAVKRMTMSSQINQESGETTTETNSDDVIEYDVLFNQDKQPIGDSVGLSVRESNEAFGDDYIFDDDVIGNLTERAVEDRWKLRLTYCQKTQTCTCGQKYILDKEGQTGAISSNPTTTNYRPNSNCLWTIEAPKNFTILVRFREFHVEREDVCGFDYVMVYTGNLQHINHPKKNGTVNAEGVFCGSQKFPQNVGNDDWADKTSLIPTSDSGDGTLNRTMFTDQWVDLKSRHVGITLVSDSDTEQTGFVLEYMTVPIADTSVPSNVNAFFDYIQEQMLSKISDNLLSTPEMIEFQEQKVNKTITRLHKASKKPCFFLKDLVVPETIIDEVISTDTLTGYSNPLINLIGHTHGKCRKYHGRAWKRRFARLNKYLNDVKTSALSQDQPQESSPQPAKDESNL